ncbi:hypothetical protein TcCL_Unassigned05926 [Trypanosoma cruzi]|nr:hypothetical protein TcCL_Unassigned05926 [Trypanosoma cruzi]
MCKQLVIITVTAGRRGRWVRGGHAASVVRVTVEVVCTRHLVVNLRQAPSDGNSIFTHHLRHSVPRRCSSRSTREKEREGESQSQVPSAGSACYRLSPVTYHARSEY